MILNTLTTVINRKNLRVASGRIPLDGAGIYIFINVDSKRRWKSTISVLSSDESIAWGNTVTLSSHASPTLSLEIGASFELGRMLGGGEVIGKLEMSWDELLDHGVSHSNDTATDIREAAQLYHELLPLCPKGTCLLSIAGGPNSVEYVIDECNDLPVDASDEGIQLRRVVLKFFEARFDQHGSIEGRPNDLDDAVSLYEELLRLRPVGHEYRDISLDNLGLALVARFNKCNDIDDVTRAVSLYRKALTLRLPGHPHRDTTLNNLALALDTRCDKLDIDEDLNEAID
ncbi:uncharacterized protein F5891DRAFT_982860 [Suillus fuscotomentosus]|uniref:Uncharacterized protein n=1 Tax=Suillus fuscotomentosus TaxID=1912939 RepID=A0AAD4E112_9AGAM|nr:uncharacterized protein F5891DRAFT_982860 [Suillus fuscotomentosus]KAG1897271.1 hypothetical protein F5891DRAFT_982860 [Suillus fuscotomentosus]